MKNAIIATECVAAILLASTLVCGSIARAQDEHFKVRLVPVPTDPSTRATTVGIGEMIGALSQNGLTLKGTFSGMNSPATMAHIHRAPKGLRGPQVFDLEVTKAFAGTIEAHLALTRSQIDDLRKGWYYVQIHTERNPDGHLRGWILQ